MIDKGTWLERVQNVIEDNRIVLEDTKLQLIEKIILDYKHEQGIKYMFNSNPSTHAHCKSIISNNEK